jgi:phosphatidate cytidylyltransferase
LTSRVLTALVGIPILLAAIWWGAPWLTLLVALAGVLAVGEFYRLHRHGSGSLPVVLGALWVLAFALVGQTASGLEEFLTWSLGVLWIGAFIAVLWLIAAYREGDLLRGLAYLLAGPVYVGFLLAHALALRESDPGGNLGRDWLFFALLVTFATDTGAFFVGRSLGTRPLAPGISPHKTWEGAFGGFVLAVVVALALGRLLDLGGAGWQHAAAGATVGIVAQAGDLLESKLKRISEVKDAGSIIPGHGGMLDRMDSLLLSIPAVYYLLNLVFKP